MWGPHTGISILLVEKGPGLVVSRDLPKLGYKGVESCELAFTDCRVPASALLGGAEGQGFTQMMRGLEIGRIQVACRALGVGRAALEDSLHYAQQRESFGRPIWQHQSIGNYLADMATKLEAARQLVHFAARTQYHRDPRPRVMGADQEIAEDSPLRKACMARVHDRLVPEILKAYQFRATRIERYLVACYEAETGGHFRAHRDNTTKGTAHRRFAVSINLNSEFEGGELSFPEYGRQLYRPDRGEALAFLRRIYPKLVAWHEYLTRRRDPDGIGLAIIVHPWESGLDNSPAWEGATEWRVETCDSTATPVPGRVRHLSAREAPMLRPGVGLEDPFRVETWTTEFEDGTASTDFIWVRGHYALVVAVSDGKVVFVRQYKKAAEEAVLGLPWGGVERSETPLEQLHMDVARSIQVVTEEVMLRMARYAKKETGAKNLCLAGGVALNCVGNGRILREGPFERIWIQPAAGDAGGALGAALFVWHQLLDKPRRTNGHDSQQASWLGPQYSQDSIRSLLNEKCAAYQQYNDEPALLDRVATLLSEGKVVGWFHGRAEFGPRALGARSILGDPRSPRMQAQMNIKIKFREGFRPFAPSVLRERVSDYFEIDADSPYMLLVAPVKEERRIPLTARCYTANGAQFSPAVRHDGSARAFSTSVPDARSEQF